MPLLERSQSGRLLTLTLNRPEKRNALNIGLCREIVEAVEDADGDPEVGAILFIANGKAFCAGMDLTEIGAASTPEIDQAQERLFTLGSRVCTPLIGAVEGAALGGGSGLVANFHIAVAAPEATFGLTEIRLGLWPFLVFRAVSTAFGERRAVELALTGRIFGAAEAQEYGLVHEVSANCRARALSIAEGIAAASPTAIFKGMAFVQDVRGRSGLEAGQIACQMRAQVFDSPEFAEALRAFRHKPDRR
jgi:enoyl-CoA hydratase/carnithine racemase